VTDDPRIAETIAATLAYQVRRDHPPHRPPVRRDAHPKHHGTVRAEVIVDPDLPAALRHGVFATPGRRYPAWIRFSNAFRVRHDAVKDARGMAVKLLGVDPPTQSAEPVQSSEFARPAELPQRAERVSVSHVARPTSVADATHAASAGSPHAAPADAASTTESAAATQDFLMVTHAVFFAATATDFLDFPAAVSSGGGIASALRVMRYFFRLRPFRCRWRAFLALRRSSVRTLSPLTLRYFSQTPYRLGPHVVKFGVRPHQQPSIADRLRLFGRGLLFRFRALPFVMPPAHWEHALRDELFRAIGEQDVAFDFLVQRRPDGDPARRDRLPIDDATIVWGEGRAPFVKVATIRIPRQPLDAAGRRERLALSEHLSFTPWHTLGAHEPLGSINQARRIVYDTIAALRHDLNGVRRLEPLPEESAADYLRRVGAGVGRLDGTSSS